MVKLAELLRRWKLKPKLLISYILLSMIPLLLLFMVSYSSYTSIIRRTTGENAEIIIDRVGEEVDILLKDSLDFATNIADNEIIQEAIRGNFNPEDKQFKLNTAAGRELLEIFDYRDAIFGIAVIGENGNSLITTNAPARDEEHRTKYWYKKALQSSFPPVHYPPHIGSFVFADDESSFVSIAVPILDSISTARIGVVLIEIKEEVFRKIMDYRLGDTGYLFIQYDRSGFTSTRSQTPDSDYLTRLAKNEEITEALLRQKREIVLIRDLVIPEVRLAAVVSLKELSRDGRRITFVLGLLVLSVLLIAVYLASSVTRSVTDPVEKLQSLMRKVQTGDLNVRMPITYKDELGELGESFNQMVERIDHLVENVKQDQILLRKTEFRVLQAQVNPHFLYNTLDSINWLSREGRTDEIVEMVSALTSLFRIVLSRGKDIITMEEEFNHVRSYLRIQKIRYEERFSYTIDMAPEVEPLTTPKIILQPLVENALYHGIKMRKGKGLIEIRARNTQRYAIIEVTDNGPGMSPQRLEEVKLEVYSRQQDSLMQDSRPTVYGLKNVNDRLKIYYGEDAGLIIHSQEGQGTTVTVKIPVSGNSNA